MSINGEIARTELVLNDGRWHHLCVTWQSAGGEWSLYINGTKVIEGAGLGIGTYIEGGGYLVIGRYVATAVNTLFIVDMCWCIYACRMQDLLNCLLEAGNVCYNN